MCYILCIPIFAFIFSSISNEFSHGTITKECEFLELLSETKEALNSQLTASCLKLPGEGHSTTNRGLNNKIDECSFKIREINLKNDKITLDGVLFVGHKATVNPAAPRTGTALDFEALLIDPIDSSLDLWEMGESGLDKTHPVYVQIILINRYYTPSDYIFVSMVDRHAEWQITAQISYRAMGSLKLIARGLHGNPHGLPGGFVRMLYLSAITTTTLGYGDIVPITSRARILVALEATLGIILIGLFLSAISRNVGKRD